MSHHGYIPTIPGTPEARSFGCTCPRSSRPVPIAGGGLAYARAADCPLHGVNRTTPGRARLLEARG